MGMLSKQIEPENPRGRPRRRSPAGSRLVHVGVYLEPAAVEALDTEVERQGLPSRSDAARRYCLEGLRRQEKRRNRTGEVEQS